MLGLTDNEIKKMIEETNKFMDNESKEFIKRIKGQNMAFQKTSKWTEQLQETLESNYPKKIFESTKDRTLKINIQNLTWKIEYDKRIDFLWKFAIKKTYEETSIDKIFEIFHKILFELNDGLHRYITFDEFVEYVLIEFENEK